MVSVSEAQAPEFEHIEAPTERGDLKALAFCESSGNILATRVDTNGHYSRGLYQFQVRTMKHYMDKFGYPELETEDYINLAYDREFSTKLAGQILETENGWKNWWSCLHKQYEN